MNFELSEDDDANIHSVEHAGPMCVDDDCVCHYRHAARAFATPWTLHGWHGKACQGSLHA
jgi:hypothetical protein